jgi:hypothetical protein
MSALWEFFAGGDVDEADLPAKEHRREPSPDDAKSTWEAMVNFFTSAEPDESDLPNKADRVDGDANGDAPASPISPVRVGKRSRDSTVGASTPAAHSLEEKLTSSTAAKLAKDTSLTTKQLSDYLVEKGAQVPPPSAKKADLIKLAQRTASESAFATPAPSAPTLRQPVLDEVEAPATQKETTPTEDKPSLAWTVSHLREYAETNGIKLAVGALKSEIYDAIVDHNASPRRSTSNAKGGRASLARSGSKKN